MKRRRARREFCVWTVPPGQRPAQLVKCFGTKKAAQRRARGGYYQVIARDRR